jgi:hypothetical protein
MVKKRFLLQINFYNQKIITIFFFFFKCLKKLFAVFHIHLEKTKLNGFLLVLVARKKLCEKKIDIWVSAARFSPCRKRANSPFFVNTYQQPPSGFIHRQYRESDILLSGACGRFSCAGAYTETYINLCGNI